MFDNTTGELVEAKGRTTRASIRLAIGQVLDYRRHVDHESLAILIPTRPNADALDLLGGLMISCVYEDPGRGFVRIDP